MTTELSLRSCFRLRIVRKKCLEICEGGFIRMLSARDSNDKQKTRLIIVEDESIIAEDLKQRLRRLNYEVPAIADSGVSAIAAAESVKPDIILMDIRLRGQMDGVEAAGIIAGNLDIPVIFLTGNSDFQTMERAKVTHPYGFILKPFKDLELQAAIEIGIYRHSMEAKLRESERRYRHLVEKSSDIIYQTGINGRFIYFNPAAIRRLGFTAEELARKHFLELVRQDYRAPVKEFYQLQFTDKLNDTYYEFPVVTKDNSIIWLGQNSHLEYEQGQQVVAFHAVARDITELKSAENILIQAAENLHQNNQTLYKLAATDDLTGLYNRRGFITTAEQQLKIAQRDVKECLLIFVDLDGLKRINDTLGHEEGSQAIIQVGNILRDCFRSSDIIARLGGDEFVVLTSVMHEKDEQTIKSRLQTKLEIYNELNPKSYRLSFSIGVSHFVPAGGKSLEEIIAEADQAMYAHKAIRRLTREN